ncbi:hypothetical protein R3P38DRAFT_1563498 [Favolaschia claudopus]|uniref:Uncharacterized protein n=1 Tax=Favolaschia claudopus TaxID=2862362 RepID=A0AAW0AJB3_9AGAR
MAHPVAHLSRDDIQTPPYPPPLVAQPAPTPAIILASVPQTAVWNLFRALEEQTHFETTTYGYWTSVLTSILPANRRFQIEPQYALRRSAPQGHQPSNSQSSIGGEHRGREVEGREPGLLLPDFMVTKAIPMVLGAARRKDVLSIIEIKTPFNDVGDFSRNPSPLDLAEAREQLENYVTRIAEIQGHATFPFVAYLVYGRIYQSVTGTQQPGQPVNLLQFVWDQADWVFVTPSPGHTPFLDKLARVSSDNWNL